MSIGLILSVCMPLVSGGDDCDSYIVDEFDAGIAAAVKPFTVWIHDKDTSADGYADRPFICHVDATSGAAIESEALQVYRQAHGLPAEGWKEYADLNGAYVFQVIAGHIAFTSIALDYDGICDTDLNAAYTMQAAK